jgi:multiple sugar transport system ATP-binding protein
MLNTLRLAPATLASRVSAVSAEAGELAMHQLCKRYGTVEALQALDLTLGAGEIVAVTGPSGAGKSTIARLVSGLEMPTSGSITLANMSFDVLPPQGRRVAHMFESFALYPTRTVYENVASPLDAPTSAGRWTADEKRRRVVEVLALAEMSALHERLPSQLSGGQKQRVALCRALVQDPSVFVLDEPIGHLDAKLRHTLRGEIRRRQAKLKQGTLWMTPDGIEAMAVADRMVVLIGGRVQQIGTPDEVFARPANVQVARLIGDPAMNVLAGDWIDDVSSEVRIGANPSTRVSAALRTRLLDHSRSGRWQMGLRPTDLAVEADSLPSASDTRETMSGEVYAVEPLGKHTIVTVDVGGVRLRAKVRATNDWSIGAPVRLRFSAGDALFFDPDSGSLQG